MSSCPHGTKNAAYNCDCWVCAQEAERARYPTSWIKILILGFLLVGCVGLGMFAAGIAGAQEARPAHGHAASEMALHDKFYSTWTQPPNRVSSCCNKQDCFPTMVRVEGGVCKAWKPSTSLETCDDYSGECQKSLPISAHWVVFDCAKLEENRPDPEQSPDGQSHACISHYTDQVFCAVRGSMQ